MNTIDTYGIKVNKINERDLSSERMSSFKNNNKSRRKLTSVEEFMQKVENVKERYRMY